MQLSMGFIWVGALLIIGGVLYTAAKALERGRLSEVRSIRSGLPRDTLEPRRPAAGFRFKTVWPGLALIACGALLLLAGATAWTPAV